jgi:uncharacterized membrane protein YphA (DoxX/SURF4 family)
MQTANERNINTGLLIMRLGIAASLLVHALPRLLDGKAAWILVGKDIRFLQFDFSTQLIGLIVLVIETLVSIGLITGYLFRLSAIVLTASYAVYFFNFISVGYKTLPLYALAVACACLGLVITGPGRFAVAVKIERK